MASFVQRRAVVCLFPKKHTQRVAASASRKFLRTGPTRRCLWKRIVGGRAGLDELTHVATEHKRAPKPFESVPTAPARRPESLRASAFRPPQKRSNWRSKRFSLPASKLGDGTAPESLIIWRACRRGPSGNRPTKSRDRVDVRHLGRPAAVPGGSPCRWEFEDGHFHCLS